MRDLESFGAQPELDGEIGTDVHRALDVAARMANNQILHRARLVTGYATDLPPVRADQRRLIQIFLNLLVNAAQALPMGSADENEIRVRTFVDEDDRVVVEIRDTGCGIPEGLQASIFDPFVPTEETDVGTGLGLFATLNLVESLDGSIRLVESSPQVGTTFHVALPLWVAEERTEQAGDLVPEATETPTARRILVVDDNAMIRAMLRRLLSRHDVAVAEGGGAAIELCGREAFDIILCDLMMPDMTGVDVYRALRESNPGLERRIVFMTGGVFDSAMTDFLNSIENIRLQKPILRETLLSLIERFGG